MDVVWRWTGHVLGMKPDWTCIEDETRFVTKTGLTWAPEGKRTRPSETWRRTVERERCEMGFKTWAVAERIAIDRKRWKDTTKSPIL